jgi:hypothetical protein
MVSDTSAGRAPVTSPNSHTGIYAFPVSVREAHRYRRCRRSLRNPLSRAALALVACAALVSAISAQHAFGAPLDPPSNITLPAASVPSACASDPAGRQCEDAAIVDLDAARARIGLVPYLLPRDFVSLPPTVQLLVLTNLDRIAYGIEPIVGLNSSIDAAAAQGVLRDSDPVYPTGMPPDNGWSSDWAGGFQNALFAYYAWVYDDGFGSGNLDCTTPHGQGCWGHRNNIIESEDSATAAMGDAVGADGTGTNGYAIEIVGTQTPLTYQYTWAQAVAAGANSPPGATARLVATPKASSLTEDSARCQIVCVKRRKNDVREPLLHR